MLARLQSQLKSLAAIEFQLYMYNLHKSYLPIAGSYIHTPSAENKYNMFQHSSQLSNPSV